MTTPTKRLSRPQRTRAAISSSWPRTGRSGISAVLLGSVTNKVLTHTNIPVRVCH
ncbi:MAG TPA: universal stress protein [Mesorhizobium sp.]|nr:universal stress protein [Mesorhizobium sp.]